VSERTEHANTALSLIHEQAYHKKSVTKVLINRERH